MAKIFLIAFIIATILIALSALLVSISKRKNIGDVDVTFDHVYNRKNLRKIVSNSAKAGKYNSPFIEGKSMAKKLEHGTKIINSNGIIYKKDNNYDCKPQW